MPTRAQRRHHLDRMKAKARRVARESWGYRVELGYAPATVDRLVGRCVKYANHLALCSGPCCGNPRRWRGSVTLAELRADDAAAAERLAMARADVAGWPTA